MTLGEVFDTKQFIKYRLIDFSVADISYFLDRLRSGNKIYDVIPLLAVVEKIPNELLTPIIKEAIEYKDISAPKKWMRFITRLFTPEKVQEILLEMISDTEDYRVKCRAVSILYCVGDFSVFQKDKTDNKLKCVGKRIFVWNGDGYENQVAKGKVEQVLENRKIFNKNRLAVLLSEFLKSDNLVYRYYIKMYLLEKVEEYPHELINQAKEVHQIVSDENFPKGLRQTEKLMKTIEGNRELEKLLYEGLNWSK